MNIDKINLKKILQAIIFSASEPLSLAALLAIFPEEEGVTEKEIIVAFKEMAVDLANEPIELKKVASGYRFQVRAEYSPWIHRLTAEKPVKYSRAVLETLALIAYRQPITRAEIEEIRGVSASYNIIKTLMDREWVKEIGYKEVPGRPGLLATTKHFLDYFNLRSLEDLPTLTALLETPINE